MFFFDVLVVVRVLACVAAGPRTRLNPLYSPFVRFRASATQAKKSLIIFLERGVQEEEEEEEKDIRY